MVEVGKEFMQMSYKNELSNDWGELLADEFSKPYYKKMRDFLTHEYNTASVYPAEADIFTTLKLTSFAHTKAVILGQDPYHGAGQSHGLCFSVKPGVAPPPSLKNIYKELHEDTGLPIPKHGHLVKWAEQGLLMLNTILTVRDGEPNSHRNIGWEKVTDLIITLLNRREQPVVFILWGAQARVKLKMIDTDRHGIITSPHPSPLSAFRGFFGSRPFTRTNELLRSWNVEEIDWCIPD